MMALSVAKPVELISERDCARKMTLPGRSSKETRAETILGCMTDKLVQSRLVVEHKELVGVISLGDILGAIIDNQQFIIEQLEH